MLKNPAVYSTKCTATAHAKWRVLSNRPFPSSLVPLFRNESKCETFHMKMSSACSFIFVQIKVIFIRMVSHLDSLWNRGTRELGNGLLQVWRVHCPINAQIGLHVTDVFRLKKPWNSDEGLDWKISSKFIAVNWLKFTNYWNLFTTIQH